MRMNWANSRGLNRPNPSATLAGAELDDRAYLVPKLWVVDNRSSLGQRENRVSKLRRQLPDVKVFESPI